jgi:hypothetical protein
MLLNSSILELKHVSLSLCTHIEGLRMVGGDKRGEHLWCLTLEIATVVYNYIIVDG